MVTGVLHSGPVSSESTNWRRDRRCEELTRWGHTIVLKFIVLVTLVGCGKIMLATELLLAMLTFERQEIDEAAVLSGALVSNGEESSRRFGGCRHGCGTGARVSQRCLYTP
jgi:hypothetical protein